MKYVDLFSGLGAFHIALKNNKCVFASDIDKFAQKIYYENFGIKPYGDIKKIDEKEIPNHDLLCAGFPCQPFSRMGKSNGEEHEKGDLFYEIIRIANFHKPKMIFLENVSDLTNKRHFNYFYNMRLTLKEIGYKTFYKVLNSKHFGVPQNRKRIYIVSFREDIAPETFFFPYGQELKIKVSDLLEKNVSEKYYIKSQKFISFINKNISKKITKINPEIALPLLARQYASWAGNFIKDEKGIRYMTGRELLRLQGFPDSYKINVSKRQIWKLTGNTISVPVIKSIFKKIEEVIHEKSL